MKKKKALEYHAWDLLEERMLKTAKLNNFDAGFTMFQI